MRSALPKTPAASARVANFFYGVLCLCAALYCCTVVVLSVAVPIPLPLYFLAVFALGALFYWGAGRLPVRDLVLRPSQPHLDKGMFALAFALCAACMGVYLLAYWPGGISSDTISQWRQVQTRKLDDWHPALHTLMLFALSRIINHPSFALVVQTLCFSLAVGYATAVLYKHGFGRKLCLLFAAYVALNPAIANVMTFLWKDCAFTLCAFLLCTLLVDIHFSREATLSRGRIAALALLLCLCAILRHNGLLLSLGVLVWLFISATRHRKRLVVVSLCTVLLFAFIKGPLYIRAHVTPNHQTVSESSGVPLTILSHIYVTEPSALSADARTLMAQLGTQETYQTHHVCGDWNALKWHLNLHPLGETTLPTLVAYALEAAGNAPARALEAAGALSAVTLQPFGDAHWRLSPYVDTQNAYNLRQEGVPFLRRVLNALSRYSAASPVSWAFWRVGFWQLLVVLFCVYFARRRPLTALLLPAALLCYNLGTTLVLSSPSDFRFFLFTPLVAPLACLVLAAQKKDTPSAQ